MQVQIFNYSINNLNSSQTYKNKAAYPKFAHKILSIDTFQRVGSSNSIAFKRECPVEFLKRDVVTIGFIQSLSGERLRKLTEIAKAGVSECIHASTYEDFNKYMNDVLSFTDKLKSNLDKKYGKDKYVFISVGQSPALIAEMLRLKGVETAICPMSGLADVPYFIHQLKKEDLNIYLDFMKKIGLDPKRIKKSKKQYIFVDYSHSNTGKSLFNFRRLIEPHGYDLPNISFATLQHLAPAEDPWVRQFIENYLPDERLKFMSPIFGLSFLKMGRVQAQMDDPAYVDRGFNMFKFLVLKRIINEEKRLSTL